MGSNEKWESDEFLISRRRFVQLSLGTLAAAGLGLSPISARHAESGAFRSAQGSMREVLDVPPLFCTAWISPWLAGQGGQEEVIAKYPMALVPQDVRPEARQWMSRIKELNPDIILLSYQIVIEETAVPGPGHDIMRQLKNAWCVYPGGLVPDVHVPPTKRRMRVFDPRHPAFGPALIEACNSVMASYPYDGLYLDQCTIYMIASLIPSVRNEMHIALQEALLALRREFPNTIIVGNSRYNWVGLNGEMVENRPNDIAQECVPFDGHQKPHIELVQSYLKSSDDIAIVKRDMAMAHACGALYGACVNNQHVLWFKAFDGVIANWRRASIVD